MQHFCGHCGAPQTVNEARFCGACGKPLGPAQPPQGEVQPAAPPSVVVQTAPQPAPQATASAGWGDRLWRALWLQARSRIPAMLLTLLPVWLLHTYLLVVKNEGYSGFQHWSAPYLNVQGNGPASFLAFGLGSAAVWSILFAVGRQGPKATLALLLGAPGRCLSTVLAGDASTRLGVALGLGLVLVGSGFFGITPRSRLLWGGGLLLWGTSYAGSLLVGLLTEASAGLKVKYGWLRDLDPGALARGLVAALPVGFLASWLLGYWLSDKLGWLALLFVAYQLYRRHSRSGASTLLLVGCWGLVFACLAQHGWADDGGWVEATGDGGLTKDNVLKWWTSVGSGRTILQGLVPAAASALGAGLSPPLEGEDPNRIIGHVLQLSADRFSLEVGVPASLTVSVWSVTAAGAQAPASGAAIQLAPPTCEGLSVTPTSGTGSFTATLTWQGGSPPSEQLTMPVQASAGGTAHSATVYLNLPGGYELVVTVSSEPFS